MTKKYIYPKSSAVNCYLAIINCADALEFYKKAFNAEENLRLQMPDGSIAHAELIIDGTLIMMSEESKEWGNLSPKTIGGSPITLSLYVENVEEVVAKAISLGAKEIRPIQEEFYGDRTGVIEDPFGYKWHIATHFEDVSEEEMNKRMKALFS